MLITCDKKFLVFLLLLAQTHSSFWDLNFRSIRFLDILFPTKNKISSEEFKENASDSASFENSASKNLKYEEQFSENHLQDIEEKNEPRFFFPLYQFGAIVNVNTFCIQLVNEVTSFFTRWGLSATGIFLRDCIRTLLGVPCVSAPPITTSCMGGRCGEAASDTACSCLGDCNPLLGTPPADCCNDYIDSCIRPVITSCSGRCGQPSSANACSCIGECNPLLGNPPADCCSDFITNCI